MREQLPPEQLFLQLLKRRIRGSFVDNVNFKTGYYLRRPANELIADVQRMAELLLEEIDNMDHLVLEPELEKQ